MNPWFFKACVVLACLAFVACDDGEEGQGGSHHKLSGETLALKEAKLIIEHNATDLDTGFQGAIDAEGWEWLEVTDPNGRTILSFDGRGSLAFVGLTELFFETVEPENAEVPIEEMLANLPEGTYTFVGQAIEMGESAGQFFATAEFSHDIPAGPALLTPAADASVPINDLSISWSPVTQTINGAPITIIAYQLIVEKQGDPHPTMIGKPNSLSMYLSPAVTSIVMPNGFLEPGAAYDWEVLAIAANGNQTLSSSVFSTQ